MTLHEAIEKILLDSGRPLSIKVIADKINETGLYRRKDNKKIDTPQIQARIRQYHNLFDNINNQIFLASDSRWRDILKTYWYLADTLNGRYSISELQFIIAALFYFKRIHDLRDRNKIYSDKALRLSLPSRSSHSFQIERSSRVKDLDIMLEYLRINNKVNFEKELEINSIIGRLNTEYYTDEEFGNIYEYLLHFDSLDSSKSPISYTPKNLRELMIGLLRPIQHQSLYDPVSGTGGLLIEALHFTTGQINVKGSEINHRIALLSYMNFEMHGFLNPVIVAENCLEELEHNEKYDLIVGDLPLNGIGSSKEAYNLFYSRNIQPPNSSKGFSSIILFILSKLNENGRAVITVSESFLFKKGKEKEIRELLIAKDLIEAVVGLPYGALRPVTEAKAALIIINNKKRVALKSKIKFIQAKAVSSDKQSLELNSEEIISLLNEYEDKKNKDVQIVESKDLLKDANLLASAYDVEFYLAQKMLEEGSGRLLGDLVDIKSGIVIEKINTGKDGDIPFLKIEDLSKDILNLYLSDESINTRVYFNEKYSKYLVSSECLLVARIGDNLKPTYFKPTEKLESILVHNGVYVLLPRGKNIDLEYLYYQLNSSFVKEQVAKFRLGAVMPYISMSGLKQILIPYVDIKSQKDFVLSQKANIIAAERAKVEDKIKLLGYKEQKTQVESDIVRTLVHQLRPTLLNIDLEVKNLKRIIEKNALSNFKEFDDKVQLSDDPEIAALLNRPINYSINELLRKIENDALQLNDVLTTVNKVMSFKLTLQDMEEVELLEFFKDYLALKKMELNDKMSIDVTGEKVVAQINKASFRDLIDQLIINAQKHGFKDLKQGKGSNRIQFSFKSSKDRNVAIIDYYNNGRPFTLTEKEFISPFQKSQTSNGSGIGGNYIYRIVQAHNGELIIKEGQKTGFSLSIEIPLIQNLENE